MAPAPAIGRTWTAPPFDVVDVAVAGKPVKVGITTEVVDSVKVFETSVAPGSSVVDGIVEAVRPKDVNAAVLELNPPTMALYGLA